MKYTLYKIVKTLGRPIYKILYFPRYYGVDNIPKEGAVILAGNHTNNLDAAMMVGSPNRVVHMIAKKELFKTKLSNWFFRSMACIPVDRSIHDEKCKNELAVLNMFEKSLMQYLENDTHKYYYLTVRFGMKTYEAYLEWCKEAKEQIKEW